MKISKRFEFGLVAAIYLASYYKIRIVSKKEIAENKNIPYKYLEIAMKLLKDSDIVESKSGLGGGYMLKADPSKITVFQLFNVLEGKIAFGDSRCAITYVYEKLESSITDVLKSISLYQLNKISAHDEYYI